MKAGRTSSKARPAAVARAVAPPRPGNVAGQFYVDATCIDCDVCRWMSSDTFSRVGDKSAVVKQPESRKGRIEAMQALLSCPTQSIHMTERDASELKEALSGMPLPVEGCEGVYHLGFHSEKSFSGTSYLIKSSSGNVMMDCPRFSPVLAKKLKEMGGVHRIVLSHIDDIADHDKWAAEFNCPRIMHKAEIRPSIDDIEVQLEGTGPWNVDGEVVDADSVATADMTILHTPGHTSGSISLWHPSSLSMFTGDTLGYSSRVGRLSIFPRYNRAGIKPQLETVRSMLSDYDVRHILPGHGRRQHIKDAAHRLQLLNDVVAAET